MTYVADYFGSIAGIFKSSVAKKEPLDEPVSIFASLGMDRTAGGPVLALAVAVNPAYPYKAGFRRKGGRIFLQLASESEVSCVPESRHYVGFVGQLFIYCRHP